MNQRLEICETLMHDISALARTPGAPLDIDAINYYLCGAIADKKTLDQCMEIIKNIAFIPYPNYIPALRSIYTILQNEATKYKGFNF